MNKNPINKLYTEKTSAKLLTKKNNSVKTDWAMLSIEKTNIYISSKTNQE